jgi:BirA family biotin operon repressor/biotin-[acetyl-CoA-carboxylase] ligase
MVRWTFQELGEVGSTQTIAKGLAAMGAPEGTTVVAKSQTSGEGRLGRSWASPVGGLYMSFILRPGKLFRPETTTLVSAVAVIEGLEDVADLEPEIRWPNDVMVNKRKIAGVVADAQTVKQEITQIIVGVGVNCNAPIPEKLAQEATSILEETGATIEVSELRHAILASFSRLYDRWQGGADLLALWKGHVKTIGRDVLVKLKTDETPFPFRAISLDEDGGLVLESPSGTKVVRVEDTEWLREQD